MAHSGQVGILVEDLFEELELWYPYHRLREAGYAPLLIGAERTTYHGKRGHDPARCESAAGDVDATRLEGLVVPGGYAPDRMRRAPQMIRLVREVAAQEKPIAAICHAAWVLISADLVRGRRLTSFPSVRDDVVNAGGDWVDEPVVVDGRLVTSRRPDDLPAFTAAFIQALEATPAHR
ncbi:MAG: type 1 glutamine amidotransferase domain-containing protein [Candidatus Eiseniibacteriota bacterium]|jgi:protease I